MELWLLCHILRLDGKKETRGGKRRIKGDGEEVNMKQRRGEERKDTFWFHP